MRTKDTRQKLNIHRQAKRPSLVKRPSLSKSIGQLHKSRRAEESPLVSIQKIHLFRKQKAFLTKQAEVFEKKAEAVKDQTMELKKKIKAQKDIALNLVKGLEGDYEKEEKIESTPKHYSRPEKVIKKKSRSFFRLGY